MGIHQPFSWTSIRNDAATFGCTWLQRVDTKSDSGNQYLVLPRRACATVHAENVRGVAMSLSDFEYTAAWTVGSLAAFGVVTICCKHIQAFSTSPSFASHVIVHLVLVCAICHYPGLTQCARPSALSANHRLSGPVWARALPEELAWAPSTSPSSFAPSDQCSAA